MAQLPPHSTPELLVGVDGGGTSLRVALVEEGASGRLRLGGRKGLQDWPSAPGFEPVPIAQQRAEAEAPVLGAAELEDGRGRLETLASAIHEVCAGLPKARLRLGLALAGDKTQDGRGICVMTHGPRQPHLLDELERALRGRQIELVTPLAELGSDGTDAGHGEQWGEGGAFADRDDALLVQLGTGVGEAVKRGGRVLDARELRTLDLPPWHARADADATVEERAGLGPIGRALAARTDHGLRPLDAARRGDLVALELLERGARALGSWCRSRAERLGGRPRVVLGARGQTLWEEEPFTPWRVAFLEGLGEGLEVVPSRLEHPALLGAAARASGRAQPQR
ncbi:MAG: ROK family protein [Planctomycetes bacterium]|nr:ROK family protein [Planctomycetota bacterium]